MEQQKAVRRKKRRPSGKNSRRRNSGISLNRINIKLIAGAVVAAALVIGLIFAVRSCSAGSKSPEKAVKTLVTSYLKGKEKKILKCYDVKKADEDLQREISATLNILKPTILKKQR